MSAGPTVLNDNDRDAAVDEIRNAKLAIAKVMYLGAMLDAGYLVPGPGEITDAALAANHALHLVECMLGLDKPEEGGAES